MGLASAAVALLTLYCKASAHGAVAGHAAAAGLLLLGPLGIFFLVVLPLVSGRASRSARIPSRGTGRRARRGGIRGPVLM